MNHNRETLCARQGNTCPSKNNCRRFAEVRGHEYTLAALYVRREPGSTACDMYLPIVVITTFSDTK